ncbi:amidase [Aspergillus clavatus NRRL 1]|uniref:Acetamidase n=1 Tax=Aspergillus clavatus (strain ATCC 1007 / CBS 513.65 / DSM 816 / NCTC 3887 / NRRL 1 / QM 1276 / 107) TaxID=344612 RepID=A1CM33_ASPCL|nr:acetamidase [Aspergillus clavatus NRRL 1]EAW08620.1 acetamidase [Aspergillus clavatus NRRL 1]
MVRIQAWTETATRKRAWRDQALSQYFIKDLDQRPPQVHNVHHRSRHDDPIIQEITDIDGVPALLECLRQGKYTAEQVVSAYIKRAAIAHQLTNCITEIVFDDALEKARQLDRFCKETGELKGPLHGIPITLKDQFNIKGIDSTLGYVGRSYCPAQEDAVLVQMLEKMGAVIIAKTNLPQSILWAETENPLWGLTVNPRNPVFTPGGSTGGEAALLALHGSIFGLGTDIGGSIRIPQSINGLYGFKPSSSRFPYHGVPVSTEGQEHVPSSVGPMARDLASICYVSRLIANAKPWAVDPKCAPLLWDETSFQEIQSRPLVIGLILDDGVVKVHPPIERALQRLSAVLEASNHEIVTWDASDHNEYIKLMDQYYTADGCEDIRRDVGVAGEPYIPHVEALINRGKAISVYDYWQLNKQKSVLQKKYLDKWNAVVSPTGRPIDVLLAPTLPHPAIAHRHVRWVGYTKIWNLLDYPAITFPVDQVRADQDGLPSEPYQPRNDLDEWNWNLYDPKTMDGHPINLQIIGKKLEEEKVLGAATVIENLWRTLN